MCGLGITSLCGLALAALAACSNVHFVGPADTSTADRPSAYQPSTVGPDGFYHGTHFRFALPAGWVSIPYFENPNVEVSIKQPPSNEPNPGIVVTLNNSPTPALPLQAYADILYHQDLSDKTAGAISPVGGIHATTLEGQPAESYTTISSGDTNRTIVSLKGGVSYIIQMVAPSSLFAKASSGPFRSFLSSWRWE